MSLLRLRFNGVESVRNRTARRPRTLTYVAALILIGLVVTGSFISVKSSASGKKRAAEQSNSSLKEKNDSGQTATQIPSAQPGPAALHDLSSASANNHWAALRRFYTIPASPAAAVITATKADALFTDVDADTKADPGDTLEYTVVISNSPAMDATNTVFTDMITDPNLMFVAGSVSTTPLARNDSYTGLVGNVSLTKNAASGLLVNDSDPDNVGPALTVTAGTFATTQGGTLTLSSDGSFTYDPPAGYEGDDTYTYTLNDNEGNTDTAVVTFNMSGMVWFINNNAGACTSSCDGRLSHPFTSLANFQAVNNGTGNHPAAGDNIFIYESAAAYVGPVTLLSNQKLIGQDATASLSTITGLTPPAGSPSFPAMDSGNATITKITSATDGINVNSVATSNLIRGLTVGSTTGIGINGSGFGTLTISDTNMDDSPSRTGQALALSNGTLTATFASIKSNNATAAGIALTSIAGSLTSGSTSITNPGGIGISIGTSSATFSFGNTTANQSANTGVSLLTNTGTITFGTLDISPDANQRGLLATDNTATITNSSGTITNSGNTAVEVTRASSTTPLALSFVSITSSGGSRGILLSNTSGSFTIAGNGGTCTAANTGGCSGGTISGKTGGDDSGTTPVGTGIALNNATNVSLTRVWIHDHSNYGIRGTSVTGLTLDNSVVNATASATAWNGTNNNSPFNDSSLRFANLLGTVNITNNDISRGFFQNIRIVNTSGSLNLTVNNCNIHDTSSDPVPSNSVGDDGISLENQTTANITAHITNNTFSKHNGDHFNGSLSGSGAVTYVITGNNYSGGHPLGLGQGFFILSSSYTGVFNYKISDNGSSGNPLVGNNSGGAIVVNKGTGGGTFSGRIENNWIGNPAVTGSGSLNAGGIQVEAHGTGSHTTLINNNKVRQFHNSGIELIGGESSGVTFDATITNNTVSNPDNVSGASGHGVHINMGTLPADTLTACMDVKNQTPNGTLAGGGEDGDNGTLNDGQFDLRIRQRQSASVVVRLPGFAGGANADAFETGQNTLTTVATSAISTFGGGAACATAANPSRVVFGGDAAKLSGADAGLSERLTVETENILQAARGEGKGGDRLQKLTPAELMAMVQVAIERWREAGISADDIARLQAMTFEIADLPEGQLAAATSTHVRIDETAAGYGWYLDSAPMTDEEFDVAVPGRELQTTEQSPAFGRMDLLTAVARELGEAYRQGKKSLPKQVRPLMQNTLSPAVRRLPNATKITLPTPVVGVEGVSQSGDTTSPVSQASTDAATASDRSKVSLNHASRAVVANSAAAPDVNVNIGTLPASKTITVKFRAQIKDPLTTPAATVCNQGTVAADGPITVNTTDPGPPAVNGATCTPLDVADLSLTKTDSPDPVSAGSNITYTLNFKNNGPSAANMVSLSDAVPANTTLVSVTTPAGWLRTDSVPVGGTGTLTFTKNADAADQETAVFTIVVKVNSNTANGATITNSATVTSPKTDPDSSNNTATASTTVQTRADLQMSKSDTPDPVIAGQNITYTVNYQNNGPSDAQTVQLSDAIPANTTFVSVTTPAGWARTDSVPVGGTGTITFTKATSVVGDTASFTLVVKVNASAAHGATITNNATASSATTDPTPGNDTGTTTTTVNRSADLELTKTDSPDVSVNAGDNITYTLTLTNHGPSNSSTVVVSDATPANTTLVSATTSSPGWSRTDVVPAGGTGTITFSKSDVGDTEVATFTIVVKVNDNAPHNSTITNTATFTSATTDPTPGNNTGTASTTVINQADLAVTKSDSPDPVTAGNNLTYTITVTNNGPGSATTASMSDAMPANTTFVSVNTPAGWTRTDAVPVGGNGTISFTNPSVANGAVAVFTLVVKVSASTANGSTISNTATVTCANESDNSNNSSGAISTTVNTSADIAVVKTDSPDPVTAGNNLTYTITITNNGPSDAQSVSLTDATPTHTTFVSEMQDNGPAFMCTNPSAGTTGTTTCTITTLAAGASAQFTIVLHVDANTPNATHIMNTASGTTTTSDPNSGNNDGTSDTTVNTSADLEVTKTDSPDPVTAGTDLTYTINFKNNGPSDAQTVTVSDATPTNTTFVSVTTPAGWTRTDSVSVGGTGTISFSKSSVANQETASFTLVVHVNSNTADGTVITNSATKSSATSDSNNANDAGQTSTTVAASADLEVTKSDSPDPVTAGGDLTYTITVTNHGPSDALTLGLSDTLPANTTFVSVTTPAGWTRTDSVPVGGTGTITFTATSLAANANAVFTLVVNVAANTAHGTVLTNDATVTTTTTDPGVFSNTGSTTTTVNAQADLSVTKSDVADPVMLGSNITYNITVHNGGAGNALGVVLTDKMPQGVTFMSATPSAGSCGAPVGNLVTCNLGDILNGNDVTVTLVIKANTVNTISDTVSVTSSIADPDPSNNQESETTSVVGFRKFVFSPTAVTGGCGSSVGTLFFTNPAPAGVHINFADSSIFVDPITPVTTVGGETSVQVTANTQIVTADVVVNVTATSGANSLVGRVKVTPVRITSLTFNPNPVVGGQVTTGTVTLTCPAPKDIEVRLSFDKAVAKPDVTTFMIPMGQSSGTFTITTKVPLSQTTATITATANGGFLRAPITVTPVP